MTVSRWAAWEQDLHPVEERRLDRVEDVRRRDEEDLTEDKGDVEENPFAALSALKPKE